jgi:hypothetical protein
MGKTKMHGRRQCQSVREVVSTSPPLNHHPQQSSPGVGAMAEGVVARSQWNMGVGCSFTDAKMQTALHSNPAIAKKKKHVFWCKHCQSRTGVVLILLLASQGKEAEVQAGD